MNETIIYGFVCPSTNELKYIGKTLNLSQRLSAHKNHALYDKRKNKLYSWYKSILDKGQTPEVLIIDKVLSNEWRFWECFYIEYFKSIGCDLKNSIKGGEGSDRKGFKMSLETRQKMSKSQVGIKRRPWKQSEEAKCKISASLKNRVYDEEFGKSVSIGARNSPKGRKIPREDYTKILEMYNSGLKQVEIARLYNLTSSSQISRIINNKTRKY